MGWCLDAVEQSDRMLLPDLEQPLMLHDACLQAVAKGQSLYVLVEPRRGGTLIILALHLCPCSSRARVLEQGRHTPHTTRCP